MNNKTIAIILNSPENIPTVAENDVLFVDGGYRFKKLLKKHKVIAIVGDFDSYKKTLPKDAEIVTLEKEKNFSDGEFAIDYIKSKGYKSATIYGANGGRLDHVLCNINLLNVAKNKDIDLKIVTNNETIMLVQGSIKMKVEKNTTISILPFNETCTVTNGKGLYYPIENLVLTKADTRGLSNVATQEEISFDVIENSALLIINNK